MKYEFNFSDGVGVFIRDALEHPMIAEYNRRFCGSADEFSDEPELTITYGDEQFEKDCVEAVKKSLENGRPFFYNAPDYIQKRMIEERENIEKGVCY